MHGLGRSSAALSVVNALPTGVGCAVGVRLYAAVTVEIEPAAESRLDISPADSSTPLLTASVRHGLERSTRPGPFAVRVDVQSEVPIAKGLKSSTAVSTATLQATDAAFGRPPASEDVARRAAVIGREVGLSATGAFDDAMAGLVPGFVLTDNRADRVLARFPADAGWSAVIHVPPGSHPPSADLRAAFSGSMAGATLAVEAARRGDWTVAMQHNTTMVERVMGYDYGGLRARLRDAGALASGVSGMGPALAAVVPSDRVRAVLAVMPAPHFAVPLASEEHP